MVDKKAQTLDGKYSFERSSNFERSNTAASNFAWAFVMDMHSIQAKLPELHEFGICGK
jgi:hypothetical protein